MTLAQIAMLAAQEIRANDPKAKRGAERGSGADLMMMGAKAKAKPHAR